MEIVEEESTSAPMNFYRRHKVAIAVSATAVICLVLNRIALQQHEKFLKERGLYDEFYNSEED